LHTLTNELLQDDGGDAKILAGMRTRAEEGQRCEEFWLCKDGTLCDSATIGVTEEMRL